jgi:chitin synthase
MSNILDKPLESAFGFITVLPGAFSAYRYVALQNDKAGQGPLEKYFAGEKMHGANAGIFTANMYLAEDRILCFELVSKRNCHWILQYVKSATGETDVPTTMAEFISQRRRWLNGSFFAAVYALAHSFDIFRSDHSFLRKTMFLVEFVYQTISMLFAWFALGNFFLVFRILTASLQNELGVAGKVLFIVFEWLYIAVLITCFILSLGNRPQGSNKWYMSMVYFWCIIMAYLMFASIFITVRSIQSQIKKNNGFNAADLLKDKIFATLIISLLSTYVMWLVVSIIFLDPWHMFTSFIQYLLMTPTYINILNVYAFCNTHDITWGTKGDDKPEKLPSVTTKADGKADIHAPTDDADLNTQYETELHAFSTKWKEDKRAPSPGEKQEDYYKGFRSGVVLFWMFCNLALSALVLQAGGLELTVSNPDEAQEKANQASTIYLAVVLYSVAGLAAFRFIGAMWFLVVRMVSDPRVPYISRILTRLTVPWGLIYAWSHCYEISRNVSGVGDLAWFLVQYGEGLHAFGCDVHEMIPIVTLARGFSVYMMGTSSRSIFSSRLCLFSVRDPSYRPRHRISMHHIRCIQGMPPSSLISLVHLSPSVQVVLLLPS